MIYKYFNEFLEVFYNLKKANIKDKNNEKNCIKRYT